MNTYLIGEIGQNHNGSLDIAKLIIDFASKDVKDELFNRTFKGFDAVKLTKRDLENELSSTAMNRIYDSPHSFGKTYGEHRKFLELSDLQYLEIFEYSKSKNLDFIVTICGINCLSLLKLFKPDYIKVASRDLTNIPLLSAIAETKIPIILSTGMGGKKELDNALNSITKYHENISILHCLSQYPADYKNINLNSIKFLKKNYSKYKIGYSDHSIGISTPTSAVALGAEIIEKHITINRNMKGTDQMGSLGIDGINKMIRDIRNLELSLGIDDIFIDKSVEMAKTKLERSIATNKDLESGSIITENDIHLLSPGDGFQWSERMNLLGKKLKYPIKKDEIIRKKDLE